MDTASQVGIRSSRRLMGEYIVTETDINSGIIFDDTIAICPSFQRKKSVKCALMHIPYRSLVPRKVENLLVAGRCFSSDSVANDILSPIQFCMAMGQAAGTAAAWAVKRDCTPRQVNYRDLQRSLIDQNVPLPDVVKQSLKQVGE